MYPFGIIGVAPRYFPAGAVIELAGIRLSCTSTPTDIWKKHGGGNRIRGHLSRGPKLRTFPSKVTRGLHPTPPMETYDGPAWRLMSALLLCYERRRAEACVVCLCIFTTARPSTKLFVCVYYCSTGVCVTAVPVLQCVCVYYCSKCVYHIHTVCVVTLCVCLLLQDLL
jgi:hypothetical protein